MYTQEDSGIIAAIIVFGYCFLNFLFPPPSTAPVLIVVISNKSELGIFYYYIIMFSFHAMSVERFFQMKHMTEKVFGFIAY